MYVIDAVTVIHAILRLKESKENKTWWQLDNIIIGMRCRSKR